MASKKVNILVYSIYDFALRPHRYKGLDLGATINHWTDMLLEGYIDAIHKQTDE